MTACRKYTLEICADSYESVQIAVAGGADRIELCSALSAGGVTPSLGLFRVIRRDFPSLPICVLIRPRAGDFFYDAAEFDCMQTDMKVFKEEGAAAFCYGILNKDGSIDTDRCAVLARLAAPLDSVLSRAFDLCVSPCTALNSLQRITPGFCRVLTSGGEQTALNGVENLRLLVKESDRLNAENQREGKKVLSIMVGAGVTDSNLEELVRRTGAREWHASASRVIESVVQSSNKDLPVGTSEPIFRTGVLHNNADWLSRRITQLDSVRRMRSILDSLTESS